MYTATAINKLKKLPNIIIPNTIPTIIIGSKLVEFY